MATATKTARTTEAITSDLEETTRQLDGVKKTLSHIRDRDRNTRWHDDRKAARRALEAEIASLRQELEATQQTAPAAPPVQPAHVARLTLSIDGVDYRLRRIDAHPEAARKAWRLRKADGTTYHVAVMDHGIECECPDFVFRREGIDPEGCKHCKALVAVGLLD